MRWFPKPIERWKNRNFWLACPSCRQKASDETFAKGRYLLSEEGLECDRCKAVNDVLFWRSQGVSQKLTEQTNAALKQNEEALRKMRGQPPK